MGYFFLNRILRKQHEERMQRRRKGKRQRYSCSDINSHIDRLPDEILIHILSFMSTRDCVRSSTLGKRWRFLWARVPNLRFNRRDHKTLTSFSNFVNRFVFTHKGDSIYSFRIAYRGDDVIDGSKYKFEIETLIATAMVCNIQVIEIHSGFELVLPQALFTSKTLVALTLNFIFDRYNHKVDNVPMVPVPGTTVYMPALKKLELEGYRCESEESLVHLLSGCPALEELTIHVGNDNAVCVFVSSPTLTRLDFKLGFFDSVRHRKSFEVKLDTPALKYLKLRDYTSEDFSAGMLASLNEADVLVVKTDSDVLSEFVGKLNNVSCLKLTLLLDMVLDSALIDSALTTEFRNLTKLEFSGDLYLLTKFLENSDNLEVLIVDMVGGYWTEPKQVPVCLIYYLRTVSFRHFNYSEPGFNMVEYILRNAKVLKRVGIAATLCHDHLKKKSEARERISLFERASVACQLSFEFA